MHVSFNSITRSFLTTTTTKKKKFPIIILYIFHFLNKNGSNSFDLNILREEKHHGQQKSRTRKSLCSSQEKKKHTYLTTKNGTQLSLMLFQRNSGHVSIEECPTLYRQILTSQTSLVFTQISTKWKLTLQ